MDSDNDSYDKKSNNSFDELNIDNELNCRIDSDVEQGDTYDQTDYFNEIDNEEYKRAPPFPRVKCPTDKDNYE
jgi:hypothetical protein